MSSLRVHDLHAISGYDWLVGVDEAGRGALAGPVVSGAVAVRIDFFETEWCAREEKGINDSKLLTPGQRDSLYADLVRLNAEGVLWASSGSASVEEISQHNILGATRLSMRRALEDIGAREVPLPVLSEADSLFDGADKQAASHPCTRVLVDGRPLKPFPYRHDALVKGDGKSLVIAMASVMAKVTRDRVMEAAARDFPAYGFAENKGYATVEHRNAILIHGPCPIHRHLFLRNLLFSADDTERQMELY